MLGSDLSGYTSSPSSPEASDIMLDDEAQNTPNKEKYSKHRPSYFTPKIKFSPQEDMLLLHAVQSLGTSDWHIVASRVPGRNARQCRERWNNYVNPSLISAPWTAKEDCFLMEKYRELGPHWRTIASYFTSRSTNSIKNRFTILQRRQKKKANRKNKEKQASSKVSASKTAQQQTYSNQPDVSIFPSETSLFFQNQNKTSIHQNAPSPLDPETESNIYGDFISMNNSTTDINETNKASSEVNKEKDAFHFLDTLKDIDGIFWSNDFEEISTNWYDVNFI